ncbi:hypothetical protein AB2T96_20620 [Clostridium butyricum]|uniref:hypothetical protein n=1 Tax=Clostridium butyricum TaxID=1492 RepID=UPI00290D5D2D|nr:hypothetical protein [Clostridium butyricum]MDU4855736.1 hypothetical protein [Clostridioides difficile]
MDNITFSDLKKIEDIATHIGCCAGLIEDLLQEESNLSTSQTNTLEVVNGFLDMQSEVLTQIYLKIDKYYNNLKQTYHN